MDILPRFEILVDHHTMRGLPTFESEPLQFSSLAAHAINAAATASVLIASISMPTSRHQTISVRLHPFTMLSFEPHRFNRKLVEMLPFASSLCILAALATGSIALQTGASVSTSPDVSKSRMYSSAISSVIAAVTPMLALIYFCPLYLLYRHSRRYPRTLNKVSGIRIQQYGPRRSRCFCGGNLVAHTCLSYLHFSAVQQLSRGRAHSH